jgi:hypothetical protein
MHHSEGRQPRTASKDAQPSPSSLCGVAHIQPQLPRKGHHRLVRSVCSSSPRGVELFPSCMTSPSTGLSPGASAFPKPPKPARPTTTGRSGTGSKVTNVASDAIPDAGAVGGAAGTASGCSRRRTPLSQSGRSPNVKGVCGNTSFREWIVCPSVRKGADRPSTESVRSGSQDLEDGKWVLVTDDDRAQYNESHDGLQACCEHLCLALWLVLRLREVHQRHGTHEDGTDAHRACSITPFQPCVPQDHRKSSTDRNVLRITLLYTS